MTKSGKDQAIVYSSGASATFPPNLRSASWSHDDKQVVYERVDYAPRPQNQPLYSWEHDQEYRYTDVFPTFYKDGTLLLTAKDVDSSVVTMKADGTDRKVVYQSTSACAMAGAMLGKTLMNCGASAGVAFQPSWSPDGTRIAFGFGSFLQGRSMAGAKVMVVNRDGSGAQELT
jgi:Tol biopolymer transport system component